MDPSDEWLESTMDGDLEKWLCGGSVPGSLGSRQLVVPAVRTCATHRNGAVVWRGTARTPPWVGTN